MPPQTDDGNSAGGTRFRRQAGAMRAQAAQAAKAARKQLFFLTPIVAVIVGVYIYRTDLFGSRADTAVSIATAALLFMFGWMIARNLGRLLQPYFAKQLDPVQAGVGGFLVRLAAVALIALISLRIAGVQLGALAIGATFTAVVIGLAAQQTFGNVLAGIVLVSARPFQVGDRVRFAGFGMDVEGTVAAHGLLYVTLTDGDDLVMVPNNTALTMSVRPLREPAAVDMQAHLDPSVDPRDVQDRLVEGISVPLKAEPQVRLEEFDGDEVIVRIKATPMHSDQGGELAGEVLDVVSALRQGSDVPHDQLEPRS
jgi:small-conductance mechanosensitive channel